MTAALSSSVGFRSSAGEDPRRATKERDQALLLSRRVAAFQALIRLRDPACREVSWDRDVTCIRSTVDPGCSPGRCPSGTRRERSDCRAASRRPSRWRHMSGRNRFLARSVQKLRSRRSSAGSPPSRRIPAESRRSAHRRAGHWSPGTWCRFARSTPQDSRGTQSLPHR